MKIFFQTLFVWQENDLVLSSEFAKIALKNKNIKNSPLSPPHTHIKIQHAKCSINGPHGKGTRIFYKTCVIVDFIVED